MKVAIVHDYLTQFGGMERILQVLCDMFPRAPIYTLLYNKSGTGRAFEGREIHTSFLQKLPFSTSNFRKLPLLMPLAVEQFDLAYFDLVISNTTSFGKGVITNPNTIHISYCSTPPRYLWEDSQRNISEFEFGFIIKKLIPFFITYLRIWDREAAQRPDYFLTNSNFVKKRIFKYYQRESTVIYPPVDSERFRISKNPGDYYLMVGRMVPYKKFDLGVEVFAKIGLPLKIIGDGPESAKLKKQSVEFGAKNIDFLGLVSEDKLAKYYSGAKALIFPQEEDFGIVPLESMLSGVPVIAYGSGGVLETVIDGITGVLFNEQTREGLVSAISRFEKISFDSEAIRKHAVQFDKRTFKSKFLEYINKVFNLNFSTHG